MDVIFFNLVSSSLPILSYILSLILNFIISDVYIVK
jgi:hypothetical protein